MILQPKNERVNERLCIIATGSNLLGGPKGDQPPVAIALGLLSRKTVKILKFSPQYRTPAFPAGSGPDFVNGAVLCETTLSREELLAQLHEIEHVIGRIRKERWGPRVIDLDLIDYDGQVAPDLSTYNKWRDLPLADQMQQAPKGLILPHPRIQDRPFVLVPMRDIVPDFLHPVTGMTIDQMLLRFSAAELSVIQRIDNSESPS